MRQTLLIASVLLYLNCHGQQSSDAIVGRWLTEPKGNMIIEVYKVNDEYKGKVTWVKETSDQTPLGKEILSDLVYNSETGMWENGKIYDPKSGKVYNSTAKIETDSVLEVRGYWNFKFFGKTMHLRRLSF
jgi:uncharacterized protein (DUF2147 family)